MELRQLEYLIAVVAHGSFTAAAESLFVSQPGVSAQIKKLEKDLGCILLDRSGSKVKLTAAGVEFLPHARQVLMTLKIARRDLDDLNDLKKGTISIGAVPNLAGAGIDLAEILGNFHETFPGIDISIIESTTAQLESDIRGGMLDVAILALEHESPRGLESITLAEDEVVAVASERVWPKLPDIISISMLADHCLLMLGRGGGVRSQLDEVLVREPWRPKVILESGDPGMLVRMAHAHLGVALVPESYVVGSRWARVKAPIIGRMALVWRGGENSSRATRAFVSSFTVGAVRG